MENLSNIGNHIVIGSPTEKIITNAIVDACDTAITSTAMSAHIRTSTLRDDYVAENWRSTATDITIAAGFKYCFGLFLKNELNTLQPRMYMAKGAFTCIINQANQFIKIYPIFGRAASNTVTANDAAPANTLTNYIALPERASTQTGLNSTTAGQLIKLAVDEKIIIRDSALDTFPVFFGFVIENHAAAVDTRIEAINCFLNLRTNIPHPIATFAGV